MPSAYLLVSHGSREERPQVAMQQLARLISKYWARLEVASGKELGNYTSNNTFKYPASIQLDSPAMEQPFVGIACLELSPKPLHEQIQEFGNCAILAGCDRLVIVPLFLLAGVHVMEDIPAEVVLAQAAMGQGVKIEISPYLGSHPGLVRLLSANIAALKADAWILLAHGSRRAGSKQAVEAIASQLGAMSAYWVGEPSLSARVNELASAGYKQVGIIPYFLFNGGITDAIALGVEELKKELAGVEILLAEPIGPSLELADLIMDLMRK